MKPITAKMMTKGSMAIAILTSGVKISGTPVNVSTIGVFPAPVTLQLQYLWQKALTLTWGFVPVDHMPELMSLIDKGVLDTKFLMTHRAPLNDIEKGYDIFGNKKDGCLKWVITPYER
jgi:alcohol dehydrogenase